MLSKSAFHKLILIVTMLLLTITAALIWLPKNIAVSGQTEEAPVNNRATALQVIKTEIKGETLRVVLRNNSDKSISDYQVAIGSNLIETSFTDEEKILPMLPQATQEEIYPVEPDIGVKGITIVGAVFTDGLSDGDAKFAEEIRNKQQGEKMVLTTVLPLLQTALDAGNSNAIDAAEDLRSRIEAIPNGENQGLPTDVCLGIQHTKNYLISRLQQIKSTPTNRSVRTELLKLKASLESTLQAIKSLAFNFPSRQVYSS